MRYTTIEGSKILEKEDTISVMEAMKKLRDFENLEDKLLKNHICHSFQELIDMIERGEISMEVQRPEFEWKDSILLKLPSVFGRKMYRVCSEDLVLEYEISDVRVNELGVGIEAYQVDNPLNIFSFHELNIGEEMFFTREDALEYLENRRQKGISSTKEETKENMQHEERG